MHDEGKRTLKTHHVPTPVPVTMTKSRIQRLRHKLQVSQEIFARSRRTVEKWEQGTSRPAGAAATLLALVEKRPDLFEELRTIS